MPRHHSLSLTTRFLGSLTLLSAVLGIAHPAIATGFNRAATNPNELTPIISEFNVFGTTETQAIDSKLLGVRKLDISKLKLTFDADVSVAFVNEGAYYRNQLGMTTINGKTQTNQILFNDLACTKGCDLTGYRDPNLAFGTPDGKALAIGDYFDVGRLEAGTTFDFFLRQDGYNRSSANVWHTDTSQNSDKLQHLMAYDYKDYLVIAWEDMTNGGDKDYNDAVFVVNIGKANIDQIASYSAAAPEPTQWAGIGLAILLGWRLQRLLKSQSKNESMNESRKDSEEISKA